MEGVLARTVTGTANSQGSPAGTYCCGNTVFSSKEHNMFDEKLRLRVAREAARMMYGHEEPGCFRAKMKAARRIHRGEVNPRDLPSDREVRQQLAVLTEMHRRREGQHPTFDVPSNDTNRFDIYRALLLPLENVHESLEYHPEGDALYHSLQVFQLAREELPYDEEFLLAALLHDVGKAIDPKDHINAALDELAGQITPRTAWLIEHHAEALILSEGTLRVRSQRRLRAEDSFDELMLLAECDLGGRATGVAVPDIDEALDYVRRLEQSCQ